MILMQNRSSDSFGDSSYAIAKAYGGAFVSFHRHVERVRDPTRYLTFFALRTKTLEKC